MYKDKNNKLLPYAKQLRREMTPQERKLWYLFLRDYPAKIYKQYIISGFIADFYCHSAKLVIEIDGNQHNTDDGKAYDEGRSNIFKKYGISVMRIPNGDVDNHFKSVCEKISKQINDIILSTEIENSE